MKKLTNSIIGGIVWAVALNIPHQAVKQFDHKTPRLDLIGEKATSAGIKIGGFSPPSGNIVKTSGC